MGNTSNSSQKEVRGRLGKGIDGLPLERGVGRWEKGTHRWGDKVIQRGRELGRRKKEKKRGGGKYRKVER